MWTFHFYVATLSWYNISTLAFPIMIFLIEACCLHGCYLTKSLKWWRYRSENVIDAITRWLTVMEYLDLFKQISTNMFKLWTQLPNPFLKRDLLNKIYHRVGTYKRKSTGVVPHVFRYLLTLLENLRSVRVVLGLVCSFPPPSILILRLILVFWSFVVHWLIIESSLVRTDVLIIKLFL